MNSTQLSAASEFDATQGAMAVTVFRTPEKIKRRASSFNTQRVSANVDNLDRAERLGKIQSIVSEPYMFLFLEANHANCY